MKVAFDNSALASDHKVRGIGMMIDEQIRALKEESKRRGDIKIDAFDFESKSGKSKLEIGNCSVVHYPYFFPYTLTLPKTKHGSKTVVTIQDLIQLIYPEKYPPGTKGKINFYRQKLRLKNVDAILTISETSKKDICRFLGVDPSIVRVVHLAPKKIFKPIADQKILSKVKKKYKLPKKFVLYVGDVNYNKNIPNLMKACKLAKTDLVIVGKSAREIEEKGVNLHNIEGPRDWIRFLFDIPHPELAHYENILDEFKKSESIHRPGFVKDDDLVAIYNLASIYCQPSYYEGFGLPVIEAMACGTAVVASKTQALVEISGKFALFADPKRPKSLAKQISKLINSKKLREEYSKKGLSQAKNYSWNKVASEMIDFYIDLTRE